MLDGVEHFMVVYVSRSLIHAEHKIECNDWCWKCPQGKTLITQAGFTLWLKTVAQMFPRQGYADKMSKKGILVMSTLHIVNIKVW